jgi:hypothetical protein
MLYIKRSRLKSLLDGWMGGWMDGWMAGKAGLRIAYSNQKISMILINMEPSKTPITCMMNDDGTRKILIELCEYRSPKKTLYKFFGHYGEIVSDIKEQLFEDGLEEGINHTGNFTLRIRVIKDTPHHNYYQG